MPHVLKSNGTLPSPPAAPPSGLQYRPPNVLHSSLRSYRPDVPKVPSLPKGSTEDRFGPWWEGEKPLPPPSCQTFPRRWELAFPSQLRDWRFRSPRLAAQGLERGWHHGMIPAQTWIFPVPIPEGEALHLDQSKQGTLISPARQRLVLVCMPPMIILREGDQVMVSDPRDLERPINASGMPQEVLTVPPGPRLLLEHELESLAWAASEDREALIGELLKT